MKCEASTARGAPCGAQALSGSRRCFWHAPATTRAAREARRLGGRNRMLALRGTTAIVSAVEVLPAVQGGEPPAWWKLEKRPEVLAAVGDTTRAVLLRRLDPRTANCALQGLQMLLAAEESKRADRRARRRYARDQLRGRFEDLLSELRGVKALADLGRVKNLVEHMAELAGRVGV